MKFEQPQPTKEEKKGNQFLASLGNKQNRIHKSEEVQRSVAKTERLTGKEVPQNPEHQIQAYINRWDNIVYPGNDKEKERNIAMLKKVFHKNHILKKENLPDSHFDLQRHISHTRSR